MIKAASSSARAFWTGVFALVLALRLMTPAGFMPSWANGPLITPCTELASELPDPANGHHGDKEKTPKAHSLCPFALAGHDVADRPIADNVEGTRIFAVGLPSSALGPDSVGQRLAAPPPPPTGPPFLA